jgi:hypothetical protein
MTTARDWRPSADELEALLALGIGDSGIAKRLGICRSSLTKLRLAYGMEATGKRGNYPRIRGVHGRRRTIPGVSS